MRPDTLRPARGARHRRKRVGRGYGSGHGTYSTKGLKGQKSRSGGPPRPGFEGGQTPLSKRLPFQRGTRAAGTNMTGGGPRPEWNEVNIGQLAQFPAGAEVTPGVLREKGLIGRGPVKVLGQGTLDRALVVRAQAFSESARTRIEAAGGKAEVIARAGRTR
ncbi:MAG: 50S ribosomal protein L15 [Armatimonadetes bacterium]|nr:50S ribosomal protein L15 [Armatimonadota bacterium]